MRESILIKKALQIAENRAHKADYIQSPASAINYLKLKALEFEREVFAVIWLDSRHGIIEHQQLFAGTIDGAAVYPREVVKAGLYANAAAVIITHNHPSGDPAPSAADKRITDRLKSALELIDIRVLDHVITAGGKHYSFAENGDI